MNFPENLVARSHCTTKRRRCSNIFIKNLRKQTPLHRQKGVQILDCKEYEVAVNKEALRDTFSNTQHRVFRKQSQAILTAMIAVYWLAKEACMNVKKTVE